MESIENPQMSMEYAINQIQGIKQTMQQIGGVDSEDNAIDTIIQNLQNNKITPKEAVKQAQNLSANRQERYAY